MDGPDPATGICGVGGVAVGPVVGVGPAVGEGPIDFRQASETVEK